MKVDLRELEEAAPLHEVQQFEVERMQRELDECRSRLEHMENIFAHVPDAILVVEPDARIVDANPAASAMFGYVLSDLLDRHPWVFLTSPARDEIFNRIQDRRIETPTTFESFCRREEGNELMIDVQMTRFDRGGWIGLCFRAATSRIKNGFKWYGTNTDIEDLKGTDSLVSAENRTLEAIAGGASLTDTDRI